jgi:hypothetical protein
VFDAAGNQASASARLERFRGTAKRQIVGLGATAGEHDFRRFSPDEIRHRRSRLVQHGLGALPEVVHARWIAEIVGQRTMDRLDDRGIWRRGRVVVKVAARHDDFCLVDRTTRANFGTRQSPIVPFHRNPQQ